MPLWDNKLMEAWYSISIEHRIDKKLFDEYIFNNLFKPLNVGFKKNIPLSHNFLIMEIRKRCHKSVYALMKKIYHFYFDLNKKKYDVNNFGAFAKILINGLDEKKLKNMKFNNINGLLGYWLISKLNSKNKIS